MFGIVNPIAFNSAASNFDCSFVSSTRGGARGTTPDRSCGSQSPASRLRSWTETSCCLTPHALHLISIVVDRRYLRHPRCSTVCTACESLLDSRWPLQKWCPHRHCAYWPARTTRFRQTRRNHFGQKHREKFWCCSNRPSCLSSRRSRSDKLSGGARPILV